MLPDNRIPAHPGEILQEQFVLNFDREVEDLVVKSWLDFQGDRGSLSGIQQMAADLSVLEHCRKVLEAPPPDDDNPEAGEKPPLDLLQLRGRPIQNRGMDRSSGALRQVQSAAPGLLRHPQGAIESP